MSRLPRLKALFRLRRSSRRKPLDSTQAHRYKQNLRALLYAKEHLAQLEKPTA